MKVFARLIFLLLFPIIVLPQAQPSQLDSLQLLLKNAPGDTARMNRYDQLGWYYAEVNRDSALAYFGKALPIARNLKLNLYESDALNGMAYALGQLGNYPKSLEYYLAAQKIASDAASEKNAWNLTNNAWNTSKSPVPGNARRDLLGWILIGVGQLYGRTGNTTTEITYAAEARNLAASVRDTTLLEVANAALGNNFFGIGKLDSAFLFLQEALSLYNSSNVFRKYEGDVLLSIGRIYQKKGNFAFAKDALLRSAKVNEGQANLSGLGESYLSLADLYQAAKDSDTSMFYARKAQEAFKKVSLPSGTSGAYRLISGIFAKQNKADSALAYLRLATAIKDSLANAERTNLLAFKNRDFDEIIKVKELEEEKIRTQTRVRMFALLAGISVFILITILLYRNNKHRQKANALLQRQKEEIQIQKTSVEKTLAELKATQAQLVQSEKMASLGELTAAIAHEIQNPLNFVNNFSDVNKELLVEMKEEMSKGNSSAAGTIADDVIDNEEKINHHGRRADAIVKGMLQHSRAGRGEKEPTDINALANEFLRLSYQGMRTKDKLFNADIQTDLDARIGKIRVVPQDMGRLLLNLYNNAFYAVHQKAQQQLNGYAPTITISTKKMNNTVQLTVKDNGTGIHPKVVDKIFQPFFTTKPTGVGVGLGLSLSYDIVKAHGGEITVNGNDGTAFTVILPVVD